MTQAQTSLANSYYEASLPQPRFAYPILSGEIDCDVCVVGGGFMGLHTALNLLEQGLKVVLLEANRVAWAASGRNGGHVIPEFGGSQRNFETHLDMQSAQTVWRIAHHAAEHLRERIANYHIDCDYHAGHIEAAITPQHAQALTSWQAHIKQHYGYENQWISQTEMADYVGSKRYIAAVIDKQGGHLHPLKLAMGLAKALTDHGADVYEHSPVTDWLAEADKVHVFTAAGKVTCANLVLGCNVGMDTIKHQAAQSLAKHILPVASWVIATEPLSAALAHEVLPSKAAVIDMRHILDYYRLSADNRMVFGGGCSYTGQESPDNLIPVMRKKMLKVFPQLADIKVEYGWGGLIDISMNRMPDFGYAEIKKMSGNAEAHHPSTITTANHARVLYAQGFSGSGIVATNAAARVISEAITGKPHDLALFQRIRHLPFVGGKLLRGPVTAAGMLYHRLLDMM